MCVVLNHGVCGHLPCSRRTPVQSGVCERACKVWVTGAVDSANGFGHVRLCEHVGVCRCLGLCVCMQVCAGVAKGCAFM